MRIFVRIFRNILFRILKKDMNEVRISDYRNSGMRIGGGCRIFTKINTSEPYLIEIGNNVTISINVELVTHDNSAIKIYDDATDFVGKIQIGNNCFIGTRAIILPGVSIADNVIVGAGSVVTKSICKEGVVVAGNPAKEINTIENIAEKNYLYRFNFRQINCEDKKFIIENNREKWLER